MNILGKSINRDLDEVLRHGLTVTLYEILQETLRHHDGRDSINKMDQSLALSMRQLLIDINTKRKMPM